MTILYSLCFIGLALAQLSILRVDDPIPMCQTLPILINISDLGRADELVPIVDKLINITTVVEYLDVGPPPFTVAPTQFSVHVLYQNSGAATYPSLLTYDIYEERGSTVATVSMPPTDCHHILGTGPQGQSLCATPRGFSAASLLAWTFDCSVVPSPGCSDHGTQSTSPYVSYNLPDLDVSGQECDIFDLITTLMGLAPSPLTGVKIIDCQATLDPDGIPLVQYLRGLPQSSAANLTAWFYPIDASTLGTSYTPVSDPDGLGAVPYNSTHSFGVGSGDDSFLHMAEVFQGMRNIQSSFLGFVNHTFAITTYQLTTPQSEREAVLDTIDPFRGPPSGWPRPGSPEFKRLHGLFPFLGDILSAITGVPSASEFQELKDRTSALEVRTARAFDMIAEVAEQLAQVTEILTAKINDLLNLVNYNAAIATSRLNFMSYQIMFITSQEKANSISLESYIVMTNSVLKADLHSIAQLQYGLLVDRMLDTARISPADPLMPLVLQIAEAQCPNGTGPGMGGYATNVYQLIGGTRKRMELDSDGVPYMLYTVPCCPLVPTFLYPVSVSAIAASGQSFSGTTVSVQTGAQAEGASPHGSCVSFSPILSLQDLVYQLGYDQSISLKNSAMVPTELLDVVSGFSQPSSLLDCAMSLLDGISDSTPIAVTDGAYPVEWLAPFTTQYYTVTDNRPSVVQVLRFDGCSYYVQSLGTTTTYRQAGQPDRLLEGEFVIGLEQGETGTFIINTTVQTLLGLSTIQIQCRTSELAASIVSSGDALTRIKGLIQLNIDSLPAFPEMGRQVWEAMDYIAPRLGPLNMENITQDIRDTAEAARREADAAWAAAREGGRVKNCGAFDMSDCSPWMTFVWVCIDVICGLAICYAVLLIVRYAQKKRSRLPVYSAVASYAKGASGQILTTRSKTTTTIEPMGSTTHNVVEYDLQILSLFAFSVALVAVLYFVYKALAWVHRKCGATSVDTTALDDPVAVPNTTPGDNPPPPAWEEPMYETTGPTYDYATKSQPTYQECTATTSADLPRIRVSQECTAPPVHPEERDQDEFVLNAHNHAINAALVPPPAVAVAEIENAPVIDGPVVYPFHWIDRHGCGVSLMAPYPLTDVDKDRLVAIHDQFRSMIHADHRAEVPFLGGNYDVGFGVAGSAILDIAPPTEQQRLAESGVVDAALSREPWNLWTYTSGSGHTTFVIRRGLLPPPEGLPFHLFRPTIENLHHFLGASSIDDTVLCPHRIGRSRQEAQIPRVVRFSGPVPDWIALPGNCAIGLFGHDQCGFNSDDLYQTMIPLPIFEAAEEWLENANIHPHLAEFPLQFDKVPVCLTDLDDIFFAATPDTERALGCLAREGLAVDTDLIECPEDEIFTTGKGTSGLCKKAYKCPRQREGAHYLPTVVILLCCMLGGAKALSISGPIATSPPAPVTFTTTFSSTHSTTTTTTKTTTVPHTLPPSPDDCFLETLCDFPDPTCPAVVTHTDYECWVLPYDTCTWDGGQGKGCSTDDMVLYWLPMSMKIAFSLGVSLYSIFTFRESLEKERAMNLVTKCQNLTRTDSSSPQVVYRIDCTACSVVIHNSIVFYRILDEDDTTHIVAYPTTDPCAALACSQRQCKNYCKAIGAPESIVLHPHVGFRLEDTPDKTYKIYPIIGGTHPVPLPLLSTKTVPTQSLYDQMPTQKTTTVPSAQRIAALATLYAAFNAPTIAAADGMTMWSGCGPFDLSSPACTGRIYQTHLLTTTVDCWFYISIILGVLLMRLAWERKGPTQTAVRWLIGIILCTKAQVSEAATVYREVHTPSERQTLFEYRGIHGLDLLAFSLLVIIFTCVAFCLGARCGYWLTRKKMDPEEAQLLAHNTSEEAAINAKMEVIRNLLLSSKQ